ncbi:MAG: Cytochrome bo(3) ubiquinol oxidase subunit 3 [Fimbriimonadales bacterium]|nr:MAG: cytochrome c oxidase subunit 3 family protein [Armatimonadota bacterium]MBV6503596.1 Cytochrome bo(3) ubiquinol oxidase subunit 3 [Fimbriimonadales bacterium]MCE7900686.1 cytochrome c oxidase subunit 3 family protein [Armatimonadetes bacterium ATM1]MDL1928566.1 cytochrome c oxidase subunit 3 family protein [Fimbriimonadia bacterium ATM]MBC6970048.1 cytochrome c oxidase subunit 3 family protein [Armatimonadota bacterium]
MSTETQEHDPLLAHQFEDVEQQTDSYVLGMWVFLVTEVLFFGGMILAFILYRNMYFPAFAEAHQKLDWRLGGVNTIVLLTSSFTMAMAVWASQKRDYGKQLMFLTITVLCALAFLVIKYFEYSAKFEHHLVPGTNFHFDGQNQNGVQLFFGLYFALTGLHGFHVLVGVLVIGVLMFRVWKLRKQEQDYVPTELVGLYWHFVDIVWIFLYPMLYLLGGVHI